MSDVDVDRIRVLHVDDDPEIVDLATTFLEREDDRLAIEPAGSAAEALDRLETGEIHCIISDYQLPDMDCRAFVDAVHEREPDFPFVLFTGRDRTQLDDALFEDGVSGYLQKGSGVDQYGELAAVIVDAVEADDVRADGGRVPADDGATEGDIDTGERGREIDRLLAEDPEAVLAGSLDAIRDGFFVLDTGEDLRYWNDFVRERTGYDDAALAAMEPTDLFVPADRDRIVEAIAETKTEGEAQVEATIETADGERLPVEFRGSRLTDATGSTLGIVGVARDVSERAAYERELERQNERLEELISAVSHDLRNPLNVISGRVQLAREMGGEEHFDALERATDRVEDLVEDLVELARQGNTVGDRTPVDLAAFATETWERLATGDATLTVETERTLAADEGRLRHVVENCFVNAVTHAGPDVTVTVGDLEGGFYVADDGPGIPPEKRERLWEYGESTTEEGTGLGLAIVRRIGEAHGWTVEMAESDSGGLRLEFRGVDGSGPPGG
jgi:PAS domain S-box-containing protein